MPDQQTMEQEAPPAENKKNTPATTNNVASLRTMLTKSEAQIAAALPSHMNAERMIRIAITAVQKTPALMKCSPLSIVGCVITASQLGLECDGILGHAYMVPYKNGKTGKMEAQLQPGYKGLLHLARNSGQIKQVTACEVFENDTFSYRLGTDPLIHHIPTESGDAGPLVYVYAVAFFKDGGYDFKVMSKAQVDAIRKRSKSGSSGPWVTDYGWMAKKTAIKQLCKLLPASVELQRATSLDDLAEAGVSQNLKQADVLGVTGPADPMGALAAGLTA